MSTYSLKGFVTIKSLVNNTPGVNSILGEASTYSLTFTKERGEYANTTYPDFTLVSIASKLDGVNVAINPAYGTAVLNVSKHVVDYAINVGGQIYADLLLTDLIATYAGTLENFECGPIVTNGTIWLPEWISWKKSGTTDTTKVWYSDPAFQAQFDEYSITVISPMARIVNGVVEDRLDDFFLAPGDVALKINARSASETMDIIQQLKDMNPETVIRTESYNYSHPSLPTFIVPTNWSVLIYGAAGDNPDSIKDAIVEYVLDNSTHPIDDWKAILPDLFRRTEYIFLPRWDIYAIENSQIIAGIHNPLSAVKDAVTFAQTKIPEYHTQAPTHIPNYLTSFTHLYKSIATLCIAGYDNMPLPGGVQRRYLWNEFPDFICVPTTSPDFGRMTQKTQGFALLLERLIVAAEVATSYSSIPAGMRKVTRDGILYLVQRYENIQYLVAARVNYPAQ